MNTFDSELRGSLACVLSVSDDELLAILSHAGIEGYVGAPNMVGLVAPSFFADIAIQTSTPLAAGQVRLVAEMQQVSLELLGGRGASHDERLALAA